MTEKRLLVVLDMVGKKIGAADSDTLYRYLEILSDDEINKLGNAVEKEIGDSKKEFVKELKEHLLIRAKPWAKN